MKTDLTTNSTNRFMQLSIMVWLAMCIGLLSVVSEAASSDKLSSYQGQQTAWLDIVTLDESATDEEPFDEALNSASSNMHRLPTSAKVDTDEPSRFGDVVTSFKARAPPYLPL